MSERKVPRYELGLVPAERTPEQQAVWEEAVCACKDAVGELLADVSDRDGRMPAFSGRALSAKVDDAIDAACLPEPEPEIELTEAMLQAGNKANLDLTGFHISGDILAAIWIAMERQRRKDET